MTSNAGKDSEEQTAAPKNTSPQPLAAPPYYNDPTTSWQSYIWIGALLLIIIAALYSFGEAIFRTHWCAPSTAPTTASASTTAAAAGGCEVSIVRRLFFGLAGLAAIFMAVQRTFWLPFLGTRAFPTSLVLPSPTIPNAERVLRSAKLLDPRITMDDLKLVRTNIYVGGGNNAEDSAHSSSGSYPNRVAYWAALPASAGTLVMFDAMAAYGDYSNSGVASVDERGVATLYFYVPQRYMVGLTKRVPELHVHYSLVAPSGALLGRVETKRIA